jgi:hypothetical protein
MSTAILSVLLVALVVGYLVRRNSRLKSEENEF